MMRLRLSKPIRKIPRRKHKFAPIMSFIRQMYDECDYCEECIAKFKAQVDNERPGHVWFVVNGEVVYLEDRVAQRRIGRPLRANEMVVHKNGNPQDNDPDNLEIVCIKSEDEK